MIKQQNICLRHLLHPVLDRKRLFVIHFHFLQNRVFIELYEYLFSVLYIYRYVYICMRKQYFSYFLQSVSKAAHLFAVLAGFLLLRIFIRKKEKYNQSPIN